MAAQAGVQLLGPVCRAKPACSLESSKIIVRGLSEFLCLCKEVEDSSKPKLQTIFRTFPCPDYPAGFAVYITFRLCRCGARRPHARQQASVAHGIERTYCRARHSNRRIGHDMKKTMQIPLGATIRVTREDGRMEIYVFRGSDTQGAIYEDSSGIRHSDVGVYVEIAIKSAKDWKIL